MIFMENKILAIVVTYFPEKDLLEKNISAFIDYVDKVLIWENTPEKQRLQYRYTNHPKVEYCGDGINSISHALNYAWKYAESNGYDYLLTMDQDSVFENFLQYVNDTIDNDQAPRGIWTPKVVSEENPKNPSEYGWSSEIYNTITSGMLQSVELVTKNGGWDEAFAIDGLDDEYCFHAQRVGIKIYRNYDIFLIQQYGIPQKADFMGRSITLRNYSAQRYYSIYWSHALLMRMFPEQKYFRELCYCYWKGMIKWIFLFEEDRFKKLYKIISGIVSGYTCRIPRRELKSE